MPTQRDPKKWFVGFWLLPGEIRNWGDLCGAFNFTSACRATNRTASRLLNEQSQPAQQATYMGTAILE
jgi:hypothetical protein